MAYEGSITDNASLASSHSMAFSMEMDPDVQNQTRKYPSISDYYKASTTDDERPIQLQHGLSNFSSLNLGDDRIAFNESILSATYRIPVEDKMAIESPSKNKSRALRKREYTDASKKVGEFEINRLERVMKDKLFQRSYATSSPFQVRKAFKFFDREGSLRISIEGFTRALEFLGFQFSELQNTALFARYDLVGEGLIEYMTFINTAMFYPAVEADFGQHLSHAASAKDEESDKPDAQDEEALMLQRVELNIMFNKVDRSKSGELSKDDFELLMMALGHHLSPAELDACFRDLGLEASASVSFPLFLEWWTDSVGIETMIKKDSKDRKK
jgi:Ca2+-binding EF-hand superfamily protein